MIPTDQMSTELLYGLQESISGAIGINRIIN